MCLCVCVCVVCVCVYVCVVCVCVRARARVCVTASFYYLIALPNAKFSFSNSKSLIARFPRNVRQFPAVFIKCLSVKPLIFQSK